MIDLIKEFPDLDSKYLQMIQKYGQDILEYEDYLKNKEYIQHGNISIYEHCIRVACLSLKKADQSKYLINKRQLCRAALLHDYFKYDWHIYSDSHRLHGIYHPDRAAKNAIQDFHIDSIEENAIRSHMWPLGFAFPHSKEAWILFWADKNSALKETVSMR